MKSRRGQSAVIIGGWLLGLGVACAGCRQAPRCPIVIFLDGAGYFGGSSGVKGGLRAAGYTGHFKTFTWTSFLGPGADHLVVARSKFKAKKLAQQIQTLRRDDPDGEIHLIGLSAGTAIVLSALEQLPEWVRVDYVVLLSSSVSAERDLTPAMRRVKRRLYATVSPHDGILSRIRINADGGPGPPAGLVGFRRPPGLTLQTTKLKAYARVVNIPWEPSYMAYGWYGGHVETTRKEFIRSVIAPRILEKQGYPLDRPVFTRQLQPRTSSAGVEADNSCQAKSLFLWQEDGDECPTDSAGRQGSSEVSGGGSSPRFWAV